MDEIARSAASTRQEIFQETANRLGLDTVIVEKDFWVCWTLGRIFSIPELREKLIFKGGTSLSKVFGVIARFSEDIDLSVRRDKLGFGDAQEPELAPNATQQKKRLDALRAACQQAVRENLLQEMHTSFTQILGQSNRIGAWELTVDPIDPYVLLFSYPSVHKGSEQHDAVYIRPIVKLEMGVVSDPYPVGVHSITSYAALEFPNLFSNPSSEVIALEAERTFWEKATLLHAEYHRPEETATPLRLSRHFSDLARLAQSPILSRALSDIILRERVVAHKTVFFRSAWAHYETAHPGSFHLMPPATRQNDLRRDYQNMREMFLEQPPPWDSVLQTLEELENKINNLVQ